MNRLTGLFLISFCSSVPLSATGYTWLPNPTSDDWNDPSNWQPDTGYPGSPPATGNDTAIFNTSNTTTITLEGGVYPINTITFRDGGYNILGNTVGVISGSFEFATNSPGILALSGNTTFNNVDFSQIDPSTPSTFPIVVLHPSTTISFEGCNFDFATNGSEIRCGGSGEAILFQFDTTINSSSFQQSVGDILIDSTSTLNTNILSIDELFNNFGTVSLVGPVASMTVYEGQLNNYGTITSSIPTAQIVIDSGSVFNLAGTIQTGSINVYGGSVNNRFSGTIQTESIIVNGGSVNNDSSGTIQTESINVYGGGLNNNPSATLKAQTINIHGGSLANAGTLEPVDFSSTSQINVTGGFFSNASQTNATFSQLNMNSNATYVEIIEGFATSGVFFFDDISLNGTLDLFAGPDFDVYNLPGESVGILFTTGNEIKGKFANVLNTHLPSSIKAELIYNSDAVYALFYASTTDAQVALETATNALDYVLTVTSGISLTIEICEILAELAPLLFLVDNDKPTFSPSNQNIAQTFYPRVKTPLQDAKRLFSANTMQMHSNLASNQGENAFKKGRTYSNSEMEPENIAISDNCSKQSAYRFCDPCFKKFNWDVYVQGYGMFGNIPSHHSIPSAHYDGGGVMLGANCSKIQDLRLGAFLNYSHFYAKASGVDGKTLVDSVNGAAYAVYSIPCLPRLLIEGLVGGGYAWYNSTRGVDATNLTAHSYPTAPQFNSWFGLEYVVPYSKFVFVPHANVQYLYTNFRGKKEHGAGAFNLTIGNEHINLLRTFLGSRFLTCFRNDRWQFRPVLDLGWIYNTLDKNRALTITPIVGPSEVLGVPGITGSMLLVDALFEFIWGKRYTISTNYDLQWCPRFRNQAIFLGFDIAF